MFIRNRRFFTLIYIFSDKRKVESVESLFPAHNVSEEIKVAHHAATTLHTPVKTSMQARRVATPTVPVEIPIVSSPERPPPLPRIRNSTQAASSAPSSSLQSLASSGSAINASNTSYQPLTPVVEMTPYQLQQMVKRVCLVYNATENFPLINLCDFYLPSQMHMDPVTEYPQLREITMQAQQAQQQVLTCLLKLLILKYTSAIVGVVFNAQRIASTSRSVTHPNTPVSQIMCQAIIPTQAIIPQRISTFLCHLSEVQNHVSCGRLLITMICLFIVYFQTSV